MVKGRWWKDGTKSVQSVKLVKEGEELGGEVALLLLDYDCNSYKRFGITDAFKAIAEGKAQGIELGFTCKRCGKHIGAVIIRCKCVEGDQLKKGGAIAEVAQKIREVRELGRRRKAAAIPALDDRAPLSE